MRPRPLPTFSKFVKTLNESSSQTSDEQVTAFRELIIALVASGVRDAVIRKQLMKEELHSYSAVADEARFVKRLELLRKGLVDLLKRDEAIDDAMLAVSGIAKGDVR